MSISLTSATATHYANSSTKYKRRFRSSQMQVKLDHYNKSFLHKYLILQKKYLYIVFVEIKITL